MCVAEYSLCAKETQNQRVGRWGGRIQPEPSWYSDNELVSSSVTETPNIGHEAQRVHTAHTLVSF